MSALALLTAVSNQAIQLNQILLRHLRAIQLLLRGLWRGGSMAGNHGHASIVCTQCFAIPEWHPSGLSSVLWSFKSVYRSRTESQWMNVAKNGDVHTVLRTVPDGNCAGSKWHVAKTT